jgi:hypothetical protein
MSLAEPETTNAVQSQFETRGEVSRLHMIQILPLLRSRFRPSSPNNNNISVLSPLPTITSTAAIQISIESRKYTLLVSATYSIRFTRTLLFLLWPARRVTDGPRQLAPTNATARMYVERFARALGFALLNELYRGRRFFLYSQIVF